MTNQKKQIKADISELRKLLVKNKPDKMTAEDVANIRKATDKLEDSSSNAKRMADEEHSKK